jgi:hypothetical protein
MTHKKETSKIPFMWAIVAIRSAVLVFTGHYKVVVCSEVGEVCLPIMSHLIARGCSDCMMQLLCQLVMSRDNA